MCKLSIKCASVKNKLIDFHFTVHKVEWLDQLRQGPIIGEKTQLPSRICEAERKNGGPSMAINKLGPKQKNKIQVKIFFI